MTDAVTIADYQRADAAGVTQVLTMPWMSYFGPGAALAEKVDGMAKFPRNSGLD